MDKKPKKERISWKTFLVGNVSGMLQAVLVFLLVSPLQTLYVDFLMSDLKDADMKKNNGIYQIEVPSDTIIAKLEEKNEFVLVIRNLGGYRWFMDDSDDTYLLAIEHPPNTLEGAYFQGEFIESQGSKIFYPLVTAIGVGKSTELAISLKAKRGVVKKNIGTLLHVGCEKNYECINDNKEPLKIDIDGTPADPRVVILDGDLKKGPTFPKIKDFLLTNTTINQLEKGGSYGTSAEDTIYTNNPEFQIVKELTEAFELSGKTLQIKDMEAYLSDFSNGLIKNSQEGYWEVSDLTWQCERNLDAQIEYAEEADVILLVANS